MSNPFEAIEKRLSAIEEHLTKLNTTLLKIDLQEKDDTIGIDEVAKMLHLSRDTVYTKTHKKLIPHRKQGKKLLFSRKRIEAYITEGEVKTFHEELKEAEKLVSKKMERRMGFVST
jgi:excisionase family DNA binding protein